MNINFSSNKVKLTNSHYKEFSRCVLTLRRAREQLPTPSQGTRSCWPSPAAAPVGAANGLVIPEKEQRPNTEMSAF